MEIISTVALIVVGIIVLNILVFNNEGLKQLKIETDRFYFKSREKAILFEQVKQIDLRFIRSSASTDSGRLKYYYTNLEITLNSNKIITLNESTNASEVFWIFIDTIKDYNATVEQKIVLTSVIPATETELNNLMMGWRKQDKKTLADIQRRLIENFASENNISYEIARKKTLFMQMKFIATCIIVFLFTVVILIIINGTTFHIG